MKRFLVTLSFILGLAQIIIAQVITAVPCDMLGMVMNVGSQETSISIYHSGQYMTSPQSENIFIWEFTDQQGNILHQDTIVDQSTIAFGHNWSLTDTINVTVHFINDSANLDNWYISEGLPPNGNSINCLFEDQIYWYIDTFPNGTPYGSWTFIHNNPGVDQNTINNCCINPEWIDLMAPCPFIEDPVIGCDGVEYANYCVAEATGITSYIDSMGNETVLEWDCNQGGDDCVDDPDGMVAQYGSSCSELAILGCDADLSAFIDGIGFGITVYEICPESCGDCDTTECVPELDPDCFAFDLWDPVCGCDGVTYSNSAYAACNNIFEYSEEECEEVQCEQDLDNDGICEDHCEEMLMTVVDCECSFFNPNTYTVFFSTVYEESCELWEDCYCECYNDADGNGICDEDEENGCNDDSNGILESYSYQCNDIVGSWFLWDCDADLSIAVPGAPSGMWTIGDLCPDSCNECDEENVIIGELLNKKKLLKIIDFLGREINSNMRFQLEVFDNGTIEKKYILE